MAQYDNTFELAMIRVFKHEGGYVNDPKDAGGETNFGVSKKAYPDVDIKNLTQDQAKDIYYKDWWIHYHYDQIKLPNVAIKLLDTAVNIGAKKANIILQRCLNLNGYPNIIDDGGLGTISMLAINHCNDNIILNAYRQAQANYYKAVVQAHPEDAKFLNGWLTRAAQ